MKVALVGLGYWGEKVLRNLVTINGVDSVIGVDCSPDRLDAVGKLYPAMTTTGSLAAALSDDAVAGVIVATPAESHAGLARTALESGRHVLVEKPLATTVSDAAQLAELGASVQRLVMVGHTFLFSPRVQTVANAICTGRIGPINYLTTARLNLGIYRSDINVIWDLAPHDFSIIFHLLGEYPIRVQTTAQSTVRAGVPDVAFMNLTFPSGVIASVVVSWRAPRKIRTTTLVGIRGMIVYDDTNPDEPVKVYDRGVVTPDSANFGENQLTYRYGETVAPYIISDEPLLLELEHFVACIQQGQPCRSDGRFGLEVVRALEAADRSWQTGLPVDLEHRASTPTPC